MCVLSPAGSVGSAVVPTRAWFAKAGPGDKRRDSLSDTGHVPTVAMSSLVLLLLRLLQHSFPLLQLVQLDLGL